MSKKKPKAAPPPAPPEFPKVIETFRRLGSWEIGEFTFSEPSVINGGVNVLRYRVTVEVIDEPIEVIHERLRKLWRECDNHHEWRPLEKAAAKHALILDAALRGVDKKPRAL